MYRISSEQGNSYFILFLQMNFSSSVNFGVQSIFILPNATTAAASPTSKARIDCPFSVQLSTLYGFFTIPGNLDDEIKKKKEEEVIVLFILFKRKNSTNPKFGDDQTVQIDILSQRFYLCSKSC